MATVSGRTEKGTGSPSYGRRGHLAIVSSVYRVIGVGRLGAITRKSLECVSSALLVSLCAEDR